MKRKATNLGGFPNLTSVVRSRPFDLFPTWSILSHGSKTGTPVVPLLATFLVGRVPLQNRLQKKVGTLILTSLLEDLEKANLLFLGHLGN